MKYNLILILFIIIICHSFSSQNYKTCNDGTLCDLAHGECIQYDDSDKKKTICKCHKGYDTNSKISEVHCNYKQKSQFKAFLLELIFCFGAGHFYLHKYKKAISKLVMFIILSICFKSFNINTKSKKLNKLEIKIIFIIVGIFYIGVFLWHIIDLAFLGKNKYKDGNNIPLSKW